VHSPMLHTLRMPVPPNAKPIAQRFGFALSACGLKNRSRAHQAIRTLSTAFPNSRSRTSP